MIQWGSRHQRIILALAAPMLLANIIGVVAMIAMIEDKRVAIAKRNLKDAIQVCECLEQFEK